MIADAVFNYMLKGQKDMPCDDSMKVTREGHENNIIYASSFCGGIATWE